MIGEPKKVWTRKTRSKNAVQEKVRKKISDKTHIRPVIHGMQLKRVIIAKTKRWK